MPATHVEAALTNGHDGHVHSSPAAKKAKGKRGMDSSEASRLLQARISQLEQDAAGEKDQEMEIGASKVCRLRQGQSARGQLTSISANRKRSQARQSRSSTTGIQDGRHAEN